MKNVIKKSWTEDTKLLNEIQNYTRTCECGHRVRLTNKYKRAICEFCGRMVYLNEEDKKRNDFKERMRKLINE